jgi:acyl-coenzyme A synthetase/AMP-(fatty) acid ligase
MTKNQLIKKIIDNCNNFPNKKILFDKNQSFSYLELLNLAYLNAQNIRKSKSPYVPIIVSRNAESVISILSVIFSNKAFCPISESTPLQRIKLIFKKLGSKKYINCSKKRINLPGKIDIKNNYKKKNIIKNKYYPNPEKTFYILFTSGSTGVPKGVKLSFNNILNTLYWSKSHLTWDNHKIGIATQFSFDISMFDLFSGLFFNVPMYIFTNPSDPFETLKEITNNKISSIFSVPTFFSNFVRYKIINKPIKYLSRIISGGDFFPQKDILSWRIKQKKISIFNVWGPTETSIVNSMYKIKNSDYRNLTQKKSIPVGKSEKRMRIIIVNEKNKTKKNSSGEICLVGKSVSKGYIGDKKNMKNYINFENKRAYLTGDLGYFDKKKMLHIIGRKDNTIKVSGYRVDAKEIENLTNKLNNVNNSTTILIELYGMKLLCLAIETKKKISKNLVTKKLKTNLPTYCLPKKIVFYKNFPLNINYKIDKKKIEEDILQSQKK